MARNWTSSCSGPTTCQDAFEGDGYQRVIASVVTADGEIDACIYVLAEATAKV
jgi:hypothetical protein